LQSRTVFKGKRVEVRVDRLVEPGNVETTRELLVHPGSVVIIPRCDDGSILLVRQYRHAAGQYLWEVPAGVVEKGERVLVAAQRELREETGFKANKLKVLLEFYPSPGVLTEKMYLVEASGLVKAPAAPDADERISVGRFTPAQLAGKLRKRAFKDGKTLVALLWINLSSNSVI
jgi:ADP-ribose diphosphatase